MPMYYPDLKSVKQLVEMMQHTDDNKKYKGIVPTDESELAEARKQLGAYMRDIWGDEVAALEIESAEDKDNYNQKFGEHIARRFYICKYLGE